MANWGTSHQQQRKERNELQVKTSPGLYGFSLVDPLNGEFEILVATTGDQAGGQTYGLTLVGVDGGMYQASKRIDGWEKKPFAEAIYKGLQGIFKKAGWKGTGQSEENWLVAILKGLNLLDPENAEAVPSVKKEKSSRRGYCALHQSSRTNCSCE